MSDVIFINEFVQSEFGRVIDLLSKLIEFAEFVVQFADAVILNVVLETIKEFALVSLGAWLEVGQDQVSFQLLELELERVHSG